MSCCGVIAGEVGEGKEDEGGDGRKGSFVVSSSTDGVLKVWSLEFFQVCCFVIFCIFYLLFFFIHFLLFFFLLSFLLVCSNCDRSSRRTLGFQN